MPGKIKPARARLIGVISDTHGLVRPEVLKAFQGVELILHAGDVGDPGVLEALRAVAPVVAVRGNVDRGEWAQDLKDTEVVEVDEFRLYVLHNAHELDLDPSAAGFDVVISGHSHNPSRENRQGVLFLNPGSAGPRRFRLPVSLALLRLEGESLAAKLIDLGV
jgi:putative phosphoesterase